MENMVKDKMTYKELSSLFYEACAKDILNTKDGVKKANEKIKQLINSLPMETVKAFQDIIKKKDRADKRYMANHDGKTKKQVEAEKLRKAGKLNQALELYNMQEMAEECFMCKVRIVVAGKMAEFRVEAIKTRRRKRTKTSSNEMSM